MKKEHIASPVGEALVQPESRISQSSSHLQDDAHESCAASSTTSASPKENRSAHKVRHKNGGIHFPGHFSLKKAKSFLHIHQEVDDLQDHADAPADDGLNSSRSSLYDQSLSDHEEHLHVERKAADVKTRGGTSETCGHHKSGVKRRASKLKSSMDKSYGDIHHLVKSVEAKIHPSSHGSSPKVFFDEDITRPSKELAKAWHAFHQNKGHRFPQDWVRPIFTREYTHCYHDEEVVTHIFCDCCQKPHCERKHFFENLVNPFHTLANIFGAHKEESEHHEKLNENENSGPTFSSIFGQKEELLPLVSEFPMPIEDVFGEQNTSEFAKLMSDFRFCRQSSFKAKRESLNSSCIQPHEAYSWDLINSSILKESKSLLSIDGKTNEEILRLMSNSTVVKEIPRVVIKLADLRNAQWKSAFRSDQSRIQRCWTVPSVKFVEPSCTKCVQKPFSSSSLPIQEKERLVQENCAIGDSCFWFVLDK